MATGGKLKLEEGTGGGDHVGFKAPDTEVDAEVIWTLPDTDGATGQVMATDGSKTLDWITPALSSELDTEATSRSNADTTLQANINTEITARANADTTLQNNINSSGTIPIGSIIAWAPGYYTNGANAGYNTNGGAVSLPDEWKICNGAALNDGDSPIFNGAGRYLPNLSDSRFLIGAASAGSVGGSNTLVEHTHSVAGASVANLNTTGTVTNGASTGTVTNAAISGSMSASAFAHTHTNDLAFAQVGHTHTNGVTYPNHSHAKGTLALSSGTVSSGTADGGGTSGYEGGYNSSYGVAYIDDADPINRWFGTTSSFGVPATADGIHHTHSTPNHTHSNMTVGTSITGSTATDGGGSCGGSITGGGGDATTKSGGVTGVTTAESHAITGTLTSTALTASLTSTATTGSLTSGALTGSVGSGSACSETSSLPKYLAVQYIMRIK